MDVIGNSDAHFKYLPRELRCEDVTTSWQLYFFQNASEGEDERSMWKYFQICLEFLNAHHFLPFTCKSKIYTKNFCAKRLSAVCSPFIISNNHQSKKVVHCITDREAIDSWHFTKAISMQMSRWPRGPPASSLWNLMWILLKCKVNELLVLMDQVQSVH